MKIFFEISGKKGEVVFPDREPFGRGKNFLIELLESEGNKIQAIVHEKVSFFNHLELK